MDALAAQAGAKYALGDHSGLGGRAVVEPRYADAALLRKGSWENELYDSGESL